MITVGKLLNQKPVERAVTIALLNPFERGRLAADATLGAARELRKAAEMNDLAADLLET